MHPQTVLKNTKIVRKALKWLWFFSQLCLFCVCVFSCNSWSMARPNHSYIKQALSMCASRCDTPGPTLALLQGGSALARWGTAFNAARLPRAVSPGKCCSLWGFFFPMESRCFSDLYQQIFSHTRKCRTFSQHTLKSRIFA